MNRVLYRVLHHGLVHSGKEKFQQFSKYTVVYLSRSPVAPGDSAQQVWRLRVPRLRLISVSPSLISFPFLANEAVVVGADSAGRALSARSLLTPAWSATRDGGDALEGVRRRRVSTRARRGHARD